MSLRAQVRNGQAPPAVQRLAGGKLSPPEVECVRFASGCLLHVFNNLTMFFSMR